MNYYKIEKFSEDGFIIGQRIWDRWETMNYCKRDQRVNLLFNTSEEAEKYIDDMNLGAVGLYKIVAKE